MLGLRESNNDLVARFGQVRSPGSLGGLACGVAGTIGLLLLRSPDNKLSGRPGVSDGLIQSKEIVQAGMVTALVKTAYRIRQ